MNKAEIADGVNLVITDEHRAQLIAMGVTVVGGVLSRELLKAAHCEAIGQVFQPVPPLIGRVAQNFVAYNVGVTRPPVCTEIAFQTAWELNCELGSLLPQWLDFNDRQLQWYQPGAEFGISPHRDESRFVGVIAIYLLMGESAFYRCDNHEGAHPVLAPAKVGDLILMRGPGFAKSNSRPYHYVGKLSRERVTFSLRHDITAAASR